MRVHERHLAEEVITLPLVEEDEGESPLIVASPRVLPSNERDTQISSRVPSTSSFASTGNHAISSAASVVTAFTGFTPVPPRAATLHTLSSSSSSISVVKNVISGVISEAAMERKRDIISMRQCVRAHKTSTESGGKIYVAVRRSVFKNRGGAGSHGLSGGQRRCRAYQRIADSRARCNGTRE